MQLWSIVQILLTGSDYLDHGHIIAHMIFPQFSKFLPSQSQVVATHFVLWSNRHVKEQFGNLAKIFFFSFSALGYGLVISLLT